MRRVVVVVWEQTLWPGTPGKPGDCMDARAEKQGKQGKRTGPAGKQLQLQDGMAQLRTAGHHQRGGRAQRLHTEETRRERLGSVRRTRLARRAGRGRREIDGSRAAEIFRAGLAQAVSEEVDQRGRGGRGSSLGSNCSSASPESSGGKALDANSFGVKQLRA